MDTNNKISQENKSGPKLNSVQLLPEIYLLVTSFRSVCLSVCREGEDFYATEMCKKSKHPNFETIDLFRSVMGREGDERYRCSILCRRESLSRVNYTIIPFKAYVKETNPI